MTQHPQQLDPQSAADLYLEDAVENAPPVKLVRMLAEGAVRFLDRAIAHSPAQDRKAFVLACQRADAIVIELRLALVPVDGSDVAPRLDSLYLFCEERIGKALLESSTEPLCEARQVLSVLLDAWQKVETPAGTDVGS
jgi:flagellar secretion chaperone FliS